MQRAHDRRLPGVVLAFAAEAHQAVVGQLASGRPALERARVALEDVAPSSSKPRPPMRFGVPAKQRSTTASCQPEALEDLAAAVARDRRDAHLGHDLEQALVGRLQVVVLGRLGVGILLARSSSPSARDRLQRQPRADRAGAVADQRGEVVDVPGVAGLDDQVDQRAQAGVQQALVDRAERQQHRDRRARRRPTLRSERIRSCAPLAHRRLGRSRTASSSAGSSRPRRRRRRTWRRASARRSADCAADARPALPRR